MKIIQYGEITFREGQGPDVHGWLVEREDSDPADATTEQLILGYAIIWAKEKFQLALNSAAMEVFREIARKKQTEAQANERGN
jgi:hypothetical protein